MGFGQGAFLLAAWTTAPSSRVPGVGHSEPWLLFLPSLGQGHQTDLTSLLGTLPVQPPACLGPRGLRDAGTGCRSLQGWQGAGKFPEEEDWEPLSNEARKRASSLLQSVVSGSDEMINLAGRSGKQTAWKKSLTHCWSKRL